MVTNSKSKDRGHNVTDYSNNGMNSFNELEGTG
jgi:hypothetical protein